MVRAAQGTGLNQIRIVVWLWGQGIDDFVAIAQRSLVQPGNVPWLVANGYDVAVAFYSLQRDSERVQTVLKEFHRLVRERSPEGSLTLSLTLTSGVHPDSGRDETVLEIKSHFFEHTVKTAVATQGCVIFALADFFFGDGTLRNMVVYANKPRVSVSAMYLRVKRGAFMQLLGEHAAATGGAPVSNARAVDMSLATLIDSFAASLTDVDANASYRTSLSLRKISDDLYAATTHVPTPILCRFEPGDETYFSMFGWNFHFIDHMWPAMLIAQNRWRLMASSDLAFFAELNPADVESAHTYPVDPGMQYNDEFFRDNLHGRLHQSVLTTLRRERLSRAGERFPLARPGESLR